MTSTLALRKARLATLRKDDVCNRLCSVVYWPPQEIQDELDDFKKWPKLRGFKMHAFVQSAQCCQGMIVWREKLGRAAKADSSSSSDSDSDCGQQDKPPVEIYIVYRGTESIADWCSNMDVEGGEKKVNYIREVRDKLNKAKYTRAARCYTPRRAAKMKEDEGYREQMLNLDALQFKRAFNKRANEEGDDGSSSDWSDCSNDDYTGDPEPAGQRPAKAFDSLNDDDEDAPSHRGFMQQFLSTRYEVEMQLERLLRDLGEDRVQSLTLTGHSLGGAVAHYGCLYFSDRLRLTKFGSTINLVTFGSPRCGDQKFADFFTSRLPDTRRYMNHQDIVPKLPPRAMGYRHAAKALFMHESGVVEETADAEPASWWTAAEAWWRDTKAVFTGEAFGDHMIDKYQEQLHAGARTLKAGKPKLFAASAFLPSGQLQATCEDLKSTSEPQLIM